MAESEQSNSLYNRILINRVEDAVHRMYSVARAPATYTRHLHALQPLTEFSKLADLQHIFIELLVVRYREDYLVENLQLPGRISVR